MEYNCYSNDTELLTDSGWKSFESISEADKLATIYIGEPLISRTFGRMEYQGYTEKYSSLFSGNMYNFYGYHTDVLVTPNHRML